MAYDRKTEEKAAAQEGMLSHGQLLKKYGVNGGQHFCIYPLPKGRNHAYLIREEYAQKLLEDPDIRKSAEERLEAEKKRQEKRELAKQEKKKRKLLARQQKKEAEKLLRHYDPSVYLKRAAEMDRKFVFHVGPTNSGKTHDAMEALRRADSGLYLGPLRLLALEMFDRLNYDGVRCNLLTGEEEEMIPGATITASTIELCDFRNRYDVVVIDEAQMISDPSRGAHWTKALLLVDAREIHVCMAPQALEIIRDLIEQIPAPYETHVHERLVPLEFSGTWRNLKDIEPGDAVIAFSRRQVLTIAAHLESAKIPASVIYGSLPPAARREEVRRFAAKETNVVVATDAIGMGISLPIRRILFFSTSKFDGIRNRPLFPSEIQQIAGRAGRFGMYDLGEVLTYEHPYDVRTGMGEEVPPILKMVIPFPKETLRSGIPMRILLEEWNVSSFRKNFMREDLTEAAILLDCFPDRHKRMKDEEPELVFDLVTCPVNTKEPQLVSYWAKCVERYFSGKDLPKPSFPLDSLESCELQYHAYDIYHQLSRRIRVPVSVEKEKEEVCKKINGFLATDKKLFLNKCNRCGKKLPWDYPYAVCQTCYARSWAFEDYEYWMEEKKRR